MMAYAKVTAQIVFFKMGMHVKNAFKIAKHVSFNIFVQAAWISILILTEMFVLLSVLFHFIRINL